MPHVELVCLFCAGMIRDLLLECVPKVRRTNLGYNLLMELKPGVAFPCPYCGQLVGFDDRQTLRIPGSGWPVIRLGLAELQMKREFDGQPHLSIEEWARTNYWLQPGTHEPLIGYSYAEETPIDEIVP
jgi:hypothetical protein